MTELGGAAIVTKPFEPMQLVGILQQVLAGEEPEPSRGTSRAHRRSASQLSSVHGKSGLSLVTPDSAEVLPWICQRLLWH